MADFDWYTEGPDRESVVVPSVAAIAVYRNGRDGLVIRQEGANGEDDDLIIVPISHVPAILEAIEKAMRD